jgi:hypothetical protein
MRRAFGAAVCARPSLPAGTVEGLEGVAPYFSRSIVTTFRARPEIETSKSVIATSSTGRPSLSTTVTSTATRSTPVLNVCR